MVLTLSIMAIIVAFSLYDYFSSRSWQMVTSRQRNETVFENRNKEYGAYQIRKDYDKRILLVFLGVTLTIGGLWGASNLFKTAKEETVITVDTDNIAELFKNTEEIPDVPEPEKADQPAAQSMADVTRFVEPVVTDRRDIEPVMGPIDPDANIGIKDQQGDGKSVWDNPNIQTTGGGTGDGKIEPVNTDPVDYVDEAAIFPGGLPALRQYIADNIDLSAIDGSSKVYLKFVVDTEGNISSVVVTKSSDDCESCEKAAVKVIKGIKEKWTPAKVNGKPVKSYFRIPITFK